MKNSFKPIFPIMDWNEVKADTTGLTKHEYFAGLAMQAIISSPSDVGLSSSYILEQLGLPKETEYVFKIHHPMYVSKMAHSYAYALLKDLPE